MKSISFAIPLLLYVMALTAEESYMYNYKTLVSDFAFDDVTALYIPLDMIAENNLSTTNIIPILFKIDSEITSGNFTNEFDVSEYDQERVIAVTYKWLAELVHTEEVAEKIKKKYDSYSISDHFKRSFIYSMLATLEGNELSVFIKDIIPSPEYSYLYKIAVIGNCRHICKNHPHKQMVIMRAITESISNSMKNPDFTFVEKSIAYHFQNYANSLLRKEILTKAIEELSKNPERISDKAILRERLSRIKRHERGEWVRRNAWWMICGVCAMLATMFGIVAWRRRGK